MAKTAYVPRVRTEPDDDPTPRAPAWPLIALPVALVTAVVAAIGSTSRQMWIDEYATFHAVSLSWSDFYRLLSHQDMVHALYYLLMRVWTTGFGTSPLALRLPSIIGMAVAAGALTLLGRRLYSASIGLTAGLLFATIPAVSRYGQEARSYAWVVAIAVLSTLALTYALERPNWMRWAVYAALTLVLTWLHFVAALVLLAHALMVRRVVRQRGDGKSLRWLVAVAVVALAAAPMLYLASKQSNQVSWIQSNYAAVQRYPEELFSSKIIVWVVVLLAIAGAVNLAEAHRDTLLSTLAWAAVPPLFTYVTYPVVHLFLAKYVLFTLPAWALLAAGALAKPLHGARVWMTAPQGAGVLAAVGVLVVAGMGAQHDVRLSPVIGEPDFRAAAAVVDAHYKAGDGIAYVGQLRTGRLPFEYELRTAKPKDVFVARSAAEQGLFYPVFCSDPAACLGNTGRVWLVVSNYAPDPFTGMAADQAALLRQNYTVSSTDSFHGVRVLLLVRKSTG